jgi:hypothetical protein
MQTPVPNIPKELLQGLANEAHSRFVADTGLAKAKVKIDLAFIEPLSEQFTVLATVIDKDTGERHEYPIEVKGTVHTVH